MDLGWRKVPTLLILLIFWKHAVGQQGWSSYDVQPHQKWPIHKVPSRWGAQSSVLEAPVNGSIPFEEVASNVLSEKGLNASRSRFSLSHQSVKGGISGSYGSVSRTQSAPSTSVSASLTLPQIQHSSESNAPLLRLAGSFVPSVQNLASQSTLQETSSPLSSQNDSSTGSLASSVSEFTYTSQGNSRPQLPGSSSQLVSTHVSGLLLQSPSIGNATGSSEYTEAATSPLGVSQSTSGQNSYSQYTSGSQSRVGTQLAVSSHVPTLGSSHGSFQTLGTTSQYAPASYFAAKMPVSRQSYPASLSGSSLYPSQSSQKWQPSASRTKVFQPSSTALSQGFQTSDASQRVSQSHRISSLSTASDGASRQIQGTSSQYGPATLDAKLPVYSQAAPSGSPLSLSQPSQLKPSLSRWSQGFQTSGTVPSQGFQTSGASQSIAQSPSRISSLATASTGGSSLQIHGTSIQSASATLDAQLPVYSHAAPSGSSLSLSQPTQLKPSVSRWSQGFQTSVTVTSQSGSPSEGSKAPSRFSTLISAASPGQFSPTQDGRVKYSGLPSQSQSALSPYRPSSPVYAKHGSLLNPSTPSTSDRGTLGSYASSSHSRTALAGSSRSGPTQTGSTFTDGSSRKLQVATSQYAPATLNVKLPVYSQAAPSGSSSSLNQPSQLKPSPSKWSQGFQASSAVASQGFQKLAAVSQSSSSSEGSKAPSRFSTLISAASPGQFSPIQDGRVKYSGLPSQSQSASSQYRPSSPVYAKHGSLLNPSTPSTSDRGTLGSYASSSHSRTALAGSSRYGPTQTFTDGSSRKLQVATSQYAPATLNVKLPVYSQAAPSGSSSSLSQPSQLKPSPSKWSQGFQASSTVASQGFQKLAAVSQSSSSSEGSKAPSRFSTLISAASPGQFSPIQDGRVKYSGLPSQSQSASSQYRPSSPVYAKHGSLLNPSTPSTSDRDTLGSYASSSHTRIGTQLAGSSHYVSTQTGITFTDGSSLKLEGTSNQYTPATLDAKLPVSRQSYPASLSGSSLYPSQSSPTWQPSASWAKVFQASSTALSQGLQTSDASQRIAPSPSRISSLTTASTDGPSLKIQDTSGQYVPATLDAKLPVYSQGAPSGSLSLSQASQVKPSISGWSQGFQTSVTVTSQSGSPSEGSKAPSRFPTLISATSPGQFSPTRDGSGKYSGLSSQSQSASSQYMPGSPVYTKHGSLPTDPSSQSTRDHSPSGLNTSISHSRIGTQLAGSSHYVSTQKGSTSSGGSLQLEGTTSQYAPATLDAKLPVYSQAAPSGSSLSLSQPSKLKLSLSRLSQGFQTSGTVPSQGFQTSDASQSIAQSPSRVSSLATASTDGPSLQIQGTSSQSAPATLGAKLPVYSEAAPSGSSLSQKWQPSASRWSQWFQASGTSVSQSSSSPQTSQLSSGSSFMPALSPPVDSAAQSRPNSISSSSRISSLSAAGLQPSEAASGSVMPRKVFPGLFASIQHPTDSMSASVGSNVQAASQGIFSGHSSDSTSVPSSRYASYGQKPSSHSRPSLSSSASRQYSSVKG